MYLSILVILLLCKIEFSEGIIGGRDAEPGEFSFVVSLRNESNKHYCGGALITTRHIVTAAHCLFTDRSLFSFNLSEMYEASAIKAVVDTIWNEEFDGEFYQASMLKPHPEYDINKRYSIFHDIGIVELQHEITNERVRPIPLPIKPVIYEKMAVVAGWGIDNRDNLDDMSQTSQVLQTAVTNVITPENCIGMYVEKIIDLAFVAEAIFAYKAFCCLDEYINVCYRDSGSPLIQDGRLAGIVIFGNVCKEGSPDIFTSVYEYLDFIRDFSSDQCSTVMDVTTVFEHSGL